MKLLIQWASRLYPAAWRKRYGREFEAMLEDVQPGWRELADILRGALAMQLRNWKSFTKLAAAAALAGGIAAAVISYRVPDRYVSRAILYIQPGSGSGDEAPAEQADSRLNEIEARNPCNPRG